MAKILARGKGIKKMLDTCNKKGLNIFNSTLVVKDPTSLDSFWVIYIGK